MHLTGDELSAVLESSSSSIKRLESFAVYVADVFEKQSGQIERIEGAVGKLQDDINGMNESMVKMRSETHWNPQEAPKTLSGGIELSVDEAELLTNNIAKIGQKAGEVDGLKMQVDMMKNRMKRLETGSIKNRSASSLPAHMNERPQTPGLSSRQSSSQDVSTVAAPGHRNSVNLSEICVTSGQESMPSGSKPTPPVITDTAKISHSPRGPVEQNDTSHKRKRKSAGDPAPNHHNPLSESPQDSDSLLRSFQHQRDDATPTFAQPKRPVSRTLSRPRAFRAPDPDQSYRTSNFVAPFDDLDDVDYRPTKIPPSTPRGTPGGYRETLPPRGSNGTTRLRQTILSPPSKRRLGFIPWEPEANGADASESEGPNPNDLSLPRRGKSAVRRNALGQRLTKTGEVDRRALRYANQPKKSQAAATDSKKQLSSKDGGSSTTEHHSGQPQSPPAPRENGNGHTLDQSNSHPQEVVDIDD
ncbi:MAG: hypothetical protein M1837_005843 [Sclerophora amabilis]|nr:MAG: hypothetical protein M1837_005843 [Sclerophora amabilis]